MAILLLNKVGVKFTAAPTDISSNCSSAVLNQVFEEIETTRFGATSRQYSKGLEIGSLTVNFIMVWFFIDFLNPVNFINDWAASNVCAALQSGYGTGLEVKVINDYVAAISATNPLYTLTVLINTLTPIGSGNIGDYATSQITWNAITSIVQTTTGTW